MNPNQCEVCRFQNEQCGEECIYAPIFPSDDPYKFKVVEYIFGFETLSFFLRDLSPDEREVTAYNIYIEADSYFDDPINGCSNLATAILTYANQTPEELAETKKFLALSYPRSVVLALPALSQMVSSDGSDDSQIDFEENGLLEPSDNGKASGDETKVE